LSFVYENRAFLNPILFILEGIFMAAKLVNKELLGLYYAVGRYVSPNSRNFWGQGAIKQFSYFLHHELPKRRGFSLMLFFFLF
jgi:hypothetical protein